jgi:tetratricopeptide (TPR) repeat protein
MRFFRLPVVPPMFRKPLFSRGNAPLKRLVTAVFLCGGLGMFFAMPQWLPGSAELLAQEGIPEDDPFADELNPFGAGGRPSDAEAPAPPAVPPKAMQLPMPFPQKTIPGEPAERRQPDDKRPATKPALEGRSEPRAAPRGTLPELAPFPEAEESESETPEEAASPAQKLLAKAARLDKEGRLEESRDTLREVIRLDPKLTIAHLALGVVCRRLGDFEGSVEACSAGLRIDPEDPELYLRRGIAWFHRGLYGIALEDFEDAAGIAYDDPRPELWRGLTLIELNRPLEAINAYASAIRRDRTFMVAYLNRGLAYLSTNEPQKAEFDFDLAIRHNPRDVRAWFNRGVAQSRQGKYREAVDSYSAALDIDPAHGPSRRNREAAERMFGSGR